jgi:hypothetical protein
MASPEAPAAPEAARAPSPPPPRVELLRVRSSVNVTSVSLATAVEKRPPTAAIDVIKQIIERSASQKPRGGAAPAGGGAGGASGRPRAGGQEERLSAKLLGKCVGAGVRMTGGG